MLNLTINGSYDKLSTLNTLYWGSFLKKKLKVGSEIEFELDGDRDLVEDNLARKLKPNRNYHKYSNGVYAIKGDGSLRNGIEIEVTGRVIDFLTVYSNTRHIASLIPSDATVGFRCGLHQHVLVNHACNINELERSVPSVIYSNILALHRVFLPALVWLFSNANQGDENYITRYEYFCKAKQLLKYTPVKEPKRYMEQTKESNHKYSFINTLHQFNSKKDEIDEFHYEIRQADGNLHPAVISAMAVMNRNIVLKAVQISEYGILETNDESFALVKELYLSIRNRAEEGFSNSRYSNKPTDEQIEKIQKLTTQFLELMKDTYTKEDLVGFKILEELNQKPCSIRNINQSREQIDEYFDNYIQSYYKILYKKDEVEEKVFTDICLKITKAVSKEQWWYLFAEKHSIDYHELKNKLSMLELQGSVRFDFQLGTYTGGM